MPDQCEVARASLGCPSDASRTPRGRPPGHPLGRVLCSTPAPLSTDIAPMPPRTLSAAACAGAFLLGLFVVCSWTIPGEGNRFAAALLSALREGGVAAAWWAGATGLGLWVVRWTLRPAARADSGAAARVSPDELALGVACGAALMLAVGSALGSMGLLFAGGGIVNWLLVAGGLFLLVRTLRESPLAGDSLREDRWNALNRWNALIGPAVGAAMLALFVAAAASAPGWLWSSERGGYDALSYHLELPKAWILGGQPVGPVEGNVYSALPSFVEAAFAQLMLMRGSIVQGAIAGQFWALIAAFATAGVVARLARRVVGDESGLVAFLLIVSLPWVLVVGTLAYNDIVPCLMFAAAWLVIERVTRDGQPLDARAAAVLALLAAAAVGAKPTAFLFVALPLLAIVVMRCGIRTLRFAPLVVLVAVAALSPWLVRNQLAYGNPLFPFAHTLFGNGPWTDEQYALFAKGHGPGLPLAERLPLLWTEWLGHGTGNPPAPGEPWFPQWGLLPIIGLVGLGLAALRDASARAALAAIAIAVVCWLLFTHLKSRFLLPTAVPLAIGAAILFARIGRLAQPRAIPILLIPSLALPFVVFWREPARDLATTPGSDLQQLHAPAIFIGDTGFMTGERFARDIERASPEERATLLPQTPVAYFINYAIPAEARVLAVGYSTPFYLGRPIAWNTVWDRGALDRVADASPGTPAVWGAKLREIGYTHVLINPTMLVVWKKAGWMNPQLEPDRWLTAFLQANPSVRTSDGCFIVELATQQPVPQTAPQPAPGAAPVPSADRPPSAS